MARVRVLRDNFTGEKYYQEAIRKLVFRRIAGAIVWPWRDIPGCVVCLGELRSKQNVAGLARHNVLNLEEYQHESPQSLLDKMALMAEDWLVGRWATPSCDKRVYLLEDLNDELAKARRRKIRYGDPQGFEGIGDVPFYHALVQRRTLEEKTLFLGDGNCADELARLKFDDEKKSMLEFPSAAALCFALAEIDLLPSGGGRAYEGGPADLLGGY